MAQYALCSTTYNCAPRLAASLASLDRATRGHDVEWRVVDNHSTDGTWQALQARMAQDPRFGAWQERCNRGRGRQLALDRATAPYVVRVDLDTAYTPVIDELLRRHAEWPDRDRYAIGTRYLDIIPRTLLHRVGGWRPLNYFEDVDLWHRLRLAGALRSLLDAPVGENWESPDPESRVERRPLAYLSRHFRNSRDYFRAGTGQSLRGKVRMEARKTRHPARFWAATVPLMTAAWLSQAHERKLPPAAPGLEQPITLAQMAAEAAGRRA